MPQSQSKKVGARKGHHFQSSVSTLSTFLPLSERNHDERAWIDGRAELEVEQEAVGGRWRSMALEKWIRFKEGVKEVQGILLLCLSQVFGAGMNATAKLLSIYGMPPWQLIFIRMAFTFTICYSYMRYIKLPDPFLGPEGVRSLLFARGCVGFFGIFGMYYSLQYLPLSDATSITFLSPILTAIISPFILHEPFATTALWAGSLSIFGVILIAKPESIFGDWGRTVVLPPEGGEGQDEMRSGPTSAQRLSAVSVALLGVVGVSGVFVIIRKIGKRASALFSINYFSFCSFFISIIVAIVMKQPPHIPKTLVEYLFIFLIAIQGFGAQITMTIGLQRLKNTGSGSFFTYTNLIWALILQRLIFHINPDFLSLLGSGIIIASAIWVLVDTRHLGKEIKEVTRERSWSQGSAGRTRDGRVRAVEGDGEEEEREALMLSETESEGGESGSGSQNSSGESELSDEQGDGRKVGREYAMLEGGRLKGFKKIKRKRRRMEGGGEDWDKALDDRLKMNGSGGDLHQHQVRGTLPRSESGQALVFNSGGSQSGALR